jgi:hypothetical protein
LSIGTFPSLCGPLAGHIVHVIVQYSVSAKKKKKKSQDLKQALFQDRFQAVVTRRHSSFIVQSSDSAKINLSKC